MIRLSPMVRPILVALALLYLLAPVVLFLFGWVEPVVAWPLALLLLAGAAWVVVAVPRVAVELGGRDLGWLAMTLCGCLLVLELLAGFMGHAPQPGDFAVRNAMYESLIRGDWPLLGPQGEYFVYYHCFCLPPALLAKFAGSHTEAYGLLYAWCWVGLALGFLLLFLRVKGRVFGLFLMLCLLGCVTEWASTGGTGFLEAHGQQGALSLMQTLFPVHNMSYVSWAAQVTWTYNHAIPCWVLSGLLLSGVLPVRHRLYAAALVVPASPLVGLCLLPLLLLQGLAHARHCGIRGLLASTSLWCAVPTVALIALYFSTGNGSKFGTLIPYLVNGDMLQACLLCVLWTLLPALLFLWPYRRSGYFLVAMLLGVVLPLIVIGVADPQASMGVRNNEFLYKGSLLLFVLLAWLYLHRWKHAARAVRFAMAFYLVSSAGMLFWRGLKGVNHYTWNESAMQENIRNDWNGHLNHPESDDYHNFWSTGTVHYPLLKEQGAAMRCYPLAPAAREPR